MVEQLIADICQYHGYTPFLAEKLFELFGVDEVSLILPNYGPCPGPGGPRAHELCEFSRPSNSSPLPILPDPSLSESTR